ncbi:hypothetical protein EJ05DRAFT_171149 [Pseudovirgaria hyperparasitica]|uniref:UBR-type domain-containing protein n=1 Tax=Pseudovirgaria hyperparasitica TaxID=470096 RepID=A0A6A6VU73_9PEZI|nr:uncharacterized protein EJ05DRAFT_171149 [Pseudovirgaria hyperparasitica]KAF2753763.1 hypothetical protein EJ05DRAFT_171149 [Pseudovirgaria hyperparasitica]
MASRIDMAAQAQADLHRSNSISQQSENSQTAAEFISSQLQLEADAREALPYQFDTCTRPFGALKQNLFSCLTCNPPPRTPDESYTPAGVCYSCSISCHGEHTLVELFAKRNFVCDCGTTRLPTSAPCTLRRDEATGIKGNITGEAPAKSNRYNQNFQNRFCGCGEDYDPHQEKGTMFQCMGLGTVEEGGCGEDWWHSECLVGFGRSDWRKHVAEIERIKQACRKTNDDKDRQATNGLSTIQENGSENRTISTTTTSDTDRAPPVVDDETDEDDDDDEIVPDGFPREDDFEYLICYKCADAFPWIKQYSGAPGYLDGVPYQKDGPVTRQPAKIISQPIDSHSDFDTKAEDNSRKRKSPADDEVEVAADGVKRQKSELCSPELLLTVANASGSQNPASCKRTSLAPAPAGQISLFLKVDFREHMCKCSDCFPLLKQNPQLIEEEETYEPPMSDDGEAAAGGSVGTGSLLDRGEAAFSNMDRVRAIEGAMVYAQLKDKVKTFLKPFAESGEAVGAEDIKAYFEKLRGDAKAMSEAKGSASEWRKGANNDDNDDDTDQRKEQSGY